MAMIGIGSTEVTVPNEPIEIGDPLMTSSKPGYVLKGTDRNPVIGAAVVKALQTLDPGTGH